MFAALSNSQIVLRPHTTDIAEALHLAIEESKAELIPWMSWCHTNLSLEETRQWLESVVVARKAGRAYEFGIFDGSSGKLVGGAGINHIDNIDRRANLGYWVRTSATRQGFGLAAARLLTNAAFEELKLSRIEIVVAIGNWASLALAARLGAAWEGIQRNRLVFRDRLSDAVMLSLVPEERPQPNNEGLPPAEMASIDFAAATQADVQDLARMNAQLIADEGHRNPMSHSQLAERMQRFLLESYQAVVLSWNDQRIGYALYRLDGKSIVYLRHFFIDRRHRRQGFGRTAFRRLKRDLWPPDTRVVVEVLAHNRRGRQFWNALGLREYSLTLEG